MTFVVTNNYPRLFEKAYKSVIEKYNMRKAFHYDKYNKTDDEVYEVDIDDMETLINFKEDTESDDISIWDSNYGIPSIHIGDYLNEDDYWN